MELASDEARLLIELALIAIGEGRLAEAKVITDAVDAFRPGDVSVFVARALSELRGNNPHEAVRVLREEGLQRHPESHMLRAFLGMSLQATGYQSQAEEILVQTSEQREDEKAAALARALLSPGDRGGGTAEESS